MSEPRGGNAAGAFLAGGPVPELSELCVSVDGMPVADIRRLVNPKRVPALEAFTLAWPQFRSAGFACPELPAGPRAFKLSGGRSSPSFAALARCDRLAGIEVLHMGKLDVFSKMSPVFDSPHFASVRRFRCDGGFGPRPTGGRGSVESLIGRPFAGRRLVALDFERRGLDDEAALRLPELPPTPRLERLSPPGDRVWPPARERLRGRFGDALVPTPDAGGGDE